MVRQLDSVNSYTITEGPSSLQRRTEYNGNSIPLYIGYAPKGYTAGTDGWTIFKFTYDANNLETYKATAYGNWTDRASYVFE